MTSIDTPLPPKELRPEDDLVDQNGEEVNIPDAGNKFEIEGPWNFHNPVHESMTIAALRLSRFNHAGEWNGATIHNLAPWQWEWIRGVFWNDDPMCYMFDDHKDSNHNFSSGTQFGWEYKFGSSNGLTQRTHFGDLQWLHCMAPRVGVNPNETRDKITSWMFLARDVAADFYNENTALGSIPYAGPLIVNPRSNIWDTTTVRMLILGSTKSWVWPEVRNRLIGTCLHIIQDSYARGHAKRVNGTGNILKVHTYAGQDKSAHSKWDSQGAGGMDPGNLDSFNNIYGARAAIDKCVEFLNLMWRGGELDRESHLTELVNWIRNSFFVIDPEARASDNKVD